MPLFVQEKQLLIDHQQNWTDLPVLAVQQVGEGYWVVRGLDWDGCVSPGYADVVLRESDVAGLSWSSAVAGKPMRHR